MKGMGAKTTIFFLAGPPFHGTSAARAATLARTLDARLVGLGHWLWRMRKLDACFPICLAGLRLWRPEVEDDAACCIVLGKGDRLV